MAFAQSAVGVTRRIGRQALIGGLAVAMSACTTLRTEPAPADPSFNDPIEPFNRAMYHLNDGIDEVLIAPAAVLYSTIVPRFGRNRVKNFVDNLQHPIYLLNEIAQLDGSDAETTSARFIVNSTAGLLGLFDPATGMGLERQQEDFGQTLAVYGVPPGPYLVLPLLGPSTTRDVVGNGADFLINPLMALDLGAGTGFGQGTRAVGRLDQRARANSTLERISESADPYAALRALYAQNRTNEIHEDADPYADLPDF